MGLSLFVVVVGLVKPASLYPRTRTATPTGVGSDLAGVHGGEDHARASRGGLWLMKQEQSTPTARLGCTLCVTIGKVTRTNGSVEKQVISNSPPFPFPYPRGP